MASPAVRMPAALLIGEVLEHILHFLPQKDIAIARRTCHFFDDAIKGSIKLQRQLFLVPTIWRGAPPTLNATRNSNGLLCAPLKSSIYPEVELNPALAIGHHAIKYIQNGEMELQFRKESLLTDPSLSGMHLTSPVVSGMQAYVSAASFTHTVSLPINASPQMITIEDFKVGEQAALQTLKREFGVEPDGLGKVRWMATFPGGVWFLVAGKPWPPPKAPNGGSK